MSASTIARWNAIPLIPDENPVNLKRKLENDGDDDDDDISLVSRTPSPAPDAMDVDENSVAKYDEYVRGAAHEVITVETKIKPNNKGFAMLAKLGWTEGQPLGISGDGRVDPIPFQMKSDSTGIGKVSQDVRMIETTVSQRRGLDSERQQKETDEQRQAREDAVARRNAVANEISDTLKAFYCSLCEKQFKNVAQYDEHTNSYAHHHKARFRDMQANARMKPQEEIDKRKEKERKREEKELRKMAAASGVKMTKPAVPANPNLAAPSPSSTLPDKPTAFKSSGWASISPEAKDSSSTPASGFKKAGWATVGSSSSGLAGTADSPKGSDEWSTASSAPQPIHRSAHSHAPAFRTGGWTSLESGSSGAALPPPDLIPLPPSPPPTLGSAPSTLPGSGGWASIAPPRSSGGWTAISGSSSSTAGDSSAVPSNRSIAMSQTSVGGALESNTTSTPSHPPSKSHVSRLGWQQFQKSNSKKKF